MARSLIHANQLVLCFSLVGCELIADFKGPELGAGGRDGGTHTGGGGAGASTANNGAATNQAKGGTSGRAYTTAQSASGGVTDRGSSLIVSGASNSELGGAVDNGGGGGSSDQNAGGTASGGVATSHGVGGSMAPVAGGTFATGGTGGVARGGAGTGVNSTAGRTTTGGAAGIAGKLGVNTGGAAGKLGINSGGVATGGVATGGVATGGVATGGVATGGVATGGVATGGNATGGASHKFRGAPCIVSPDDTNFEMIARGNDSRIYRYALSGIIDGPWENLSDLNATSSSIDNRSDLNCSANTSAVHIVASGPAGQLLHTYGSGSTYNSFVPETIPSTYPTTYDPTPAIGVNRGNPSDLVWRLVATTGNHYWSWQVSSNAGTLSTSPFGNLVNGNYPMGPDAAWQVISGSSHFLVLGVAQSNSLILEDYMASNGYPNGLWIDPVPASTPAPSGTTYTYRPTICTGTYQSTPFVYLAAVAGGKLYVATQAPLPYPGNTYGIFNWTSAGNETLTSAPDCAALGTGVMSIVALSSTGSVLLYQHNPQVVGMWAAPRDLGTF